MKCKWKDCNNDARAKSPFCSGTCKKRYQRTSGTESEPSGTNVPVEVGQEPSGTQVGHKMQSMVTLRTDLQYDCLWAMLPDGVAMPMTEPTEATHAMTSEALRRRVSNYKGTTWIGSPEYAETIYRLLTQDLDSLRASGQFIPAWKENAA